MQQSPVWTPVSAACVMCTAWNFSVRRCEIIDYLGSKCQLSMAKLQRLKSAPLNPPQTNPSSALPREQQPLCRTPLQSTTPFTAPLPFKQGKHLQAGVAEGKKGVAAYCAVGRGSGSPMQQ
eukprot:1148953-Pelagomonas_calceolata.AAC.5